MSVPRTKSTRLLTRPGRPVPSLAASRPGLSGADTRACSSIRMGIRGRWRTTLAGRCAPTARSASAASWSAAGTDLFDTIVYSHEVGLVKPDPRIYALLCAELRVAPGELVFLDDVPENVEAARRFGIQGELHRSTPKGGPLPTPTSPR